MSEREAFVRRFHAAHPGVTTAAFARGPTYARLAGAVASHERVLDLGCGDGYLMTLIGDARAVGVDLSDAELRLAHARGLRVVRARAQALPFARGAFDAVVSHLAFTLMDDVDAIAAELARVLAPGGTFAAIVGGGPTADAREDDAMLRWLGLLARASITAPRLGDPRARTAAGWRAILEPHGFDTIAFERIVVDLGGTFADVWTTLSTLYEADGVDLATLRVALASHYADDARVPCEMVVWLATATLAITR